MTLLGETYFKRNFRFSEPYGEANETRETRLMRVINYSASYPFREPQEVVFFKELTDC